MTSYGFLLFDDAEELDFVGPWEVITASSMLRVRDGADPDTTVMIAETDSPVRCAKGMVVLPHHSIDDHPPLDVIVVPGGQGTRVEIDNETLLAWLGFHRPIGDVGHQRVHGLAVVGRCRAGHQQAGGHPLVVRGHPGRAGRLHGRP
jgi:transcriptional regulator GlxA family with amidase domain